MADFSDYLENKLLAHVFGGVTYTKPTAVYAALFTSSPNDAGGGTEVNGGAYARQPVTFGTATGGVIQNTAQMDFTANGADFGNIVAVGVFDALTGGNLLTWRIISTIAILDGDRLSFKIGDFDIALD